MATASGNRRIIGLRRSLFCIVTERPMEWFGSLSMMVIAGILMMPGQTFSLPSYAAFVADGISEVQAIAFFGGIGVVRIYALATGGKTSNARVRQVGAAINGGACIFASSTFAETYFMGQPMPVTAGLFGLIALFEGYSIQRAGLDRNGV